MQNISEAIVQLNDIINSIVWGPPMMLLIVGTGLFFSIRTGFLQFRKFRYAMKNTLGNAFKKEKGRNKGEISPFQAVTTALAGTVGTGNIAGVAGAISLGGRGAVIWMWISALVGMITKYSEVLLAVKFRERSKQGDWVGGPMYYISNGLGKNWRWLAVVFSVFAMFASFGIGNMTQVNTISGSVVTLINEFTAGSVMAGGKADITIRLAVGFIVSFAAALVLLGGMKRIGAVSEKLVPAMSIIYIIGTFTVIFANIGNIGSAFSAIFIGAFSPDAVLGGAVGVSIMQVMKQGVGRGIFSNEAGLGSAPIAHAATSETDPAKQGLFGIFEVFIDTIVICTLTALAILISGVCIPYGRNSGVELSISAFSSAFGGKAASIIITSCITLFAISTILSWALYGSRCAEYIFGTKALTPYKIFFIIFIVIGSAMNLSLAWSIADTLNGLMAIPNLLALLGLSGIVIETTKEHFRHTNDSNSSSKQGK